jgi:phosphatidate phosphatase APP1
VRRERLGTVLLRVVLAVEDALQALLLLGLSVLGRRRVAVLPFVGHGTPERVHVRARVVLGGRATREVAVAPAVAGRGAAAAAREVAVSREVAPVTREVAGAPAGRSSAGPETDAGRQAGSVGVGRRWVVVGRERWAIFREAVAPFLTVEVPRARVVVRGPAGETVARCDRQGYLDVEVPGGGLTPGWHELAVTARWRGAVVTVPARVLVVGPGSPVAVVSDLDDTVIETGITRGLEFLRLTLLTRVTDRTPLPGAAELYRALAAARGGSPALPVFYVSTSPWNLYGLLSRFIALRGFPAGPLLLTDWGPSRTNLFRIGAQEHKLGLIRTILDEHPGLGVVLVGDTGQLDPEIYVAAAVEAPDRVRAIYVRRTSDITAARAVEVGGLVRRAAAVGVPMVMVEDSVQIARHAAGLGLVTDADVTAVQRAMPT